MNRDKAAVLPQLFLKKLRDFLIFSLFRKEKADLKPYNK